MYWLGLVILSIAVGHRYEQIDGWMMLGVGMIAFVLLFWRFEETRKD